MHSPLTPSQARFINRWKLLGGKACPVDGLIHADFEQNMACVARFGAEGWKLLQVGDLHHEANGVRMSGYLDNFLADDIAEQRLREIAKVAAGTAPVVIQEMGTIGDSRENWAKLALLPVRPPAGASAAVAGICEWYSVCPPLELGCLEEVVGRYCPPDLTARFKGTGRSSPRQRLEVLDLLLDGAFGELTGSDMALLVMVVMDTQSVTWLPGYDGGEGSAAV